VLGRTPQQIYPYLQTVRNTVLTDMHQEATADEILARIKKLRDGQRTEVDLRALDLLEALIERASSEVQNQPGPHFQGCLAALRRAFERRWAAGEPLLMAVYLSNFGRLPDPKLSDEQLRELTELLKQVPNDSRDQLLIASELARLLYWSYGRKADGLQRLEAAIQGYDGAHQGHWPYEDDNVLSDYVTMLDDSGRETAAETLLTRLSEKVELPAQRDWFEGQIWTVYHHALEYDGAVSLGHGEGLFSVMVAESTRQLLAAANDVRRLSIANRFANTLAIAVRKKIGKYPDAVRKFAFELVPQALAKQQSQYGSLAASPYSVVRDALGEIAALRYLVERMEQWPQRLQFTYDNAWRALGSTLAAARRDTNLRAPDAAGLEPRVLKLVLAELRQYLETDESNDQSMYYRGQSPYFWSAKADDFARVASEVYEAHKTSSRRAVAVAQYLWSGLDRQSRSIEILFLAHHAGLLDLNGQQMLANELQATHRYAESIAILEPLVQADPGSMYRRTQLMAGYFHAERPEQLQQLVQATDAYFHQGGRWTAESIGPFASACRDCNLFEQAIHYFHEAISAIQRANPGSTAGNSRLSQWYQELAGAESAVHHTQAAVEAASAAVVCWSAQLSNRQAAVSNLVNVLLAAHDLDAYVAGLDEAANKSGQDSPLLRKALGQVYQQKKEFAKAIVQFELARQLQPNDKQTLQGLIACYDAAQKPAEANKLLLALLDFDRHDLTLYRQLAERYRQNEPEAERAATSIIEAGPTEAENHQALAELRQQQNRWGEAIAQWKAVAELRRLEPNGLLKLAAAEIHEKQWDAARDTLDRLRKTEWPSRFNTVSVETQALRNQLPK
ncbi:MAG TPA: hypothetical protein VFE24_16565, partial [Pirellulales bacterium]|nr:hypothetical protein [Pirellulales bacterium]